MPSPVLFGISVGFGLTVWGVVAWHYIWPALRERPSPENLKPILLLHAFRFLGLAFVVPGVVSSDLPATFAQPIAYGDLISAILALLALATLGTRTGYIGDLGFQYLRNGGPALCLLPGRPHITPRYPRLVGRWLFYLGGLRAFTSHNPWLGVPNTVTSQGSRAVTEQGTYRLTHKMERQGQK